MHDSKFKEARDRYTENHERLEKDTKVEMCPIPMERKDKLLKFMKQICRFNAISIRTPLIFLELKEILKLMWNCERLKGIKVGAKREASQVLMPRQTAKAPALKQHKADASETQSRGRGRRPGTSPHVHSHRFFENVLKTYTGARVAASVNFRCWDHWICTCKTRRLHLLSLLSTHNLEIH